MKGLPGKLLPEERALTSAFQPRGNVGRAGLGRAPRPTAPPSPPPGGGPAAQPPSQWPGEMTDSAAPPALPLCPPPGSPPQRRWLVPTCPAVSAVSARAVVGHPSGGGHREWGGTVGAGAARPGTSSRASGRGGSGGARSPHPFSLTAPPFPWQKQSGVFPHTRGFTPSAFAEAGEKFFLAYGRLLVIKHFFANE